MKMFREDRDLRNQRTALWHKRNKHKSMCTVAKARARSQKVPFEITPEDIVFPEMCPILGIPLFFTDGRRTDNTPSLDRIEPAKGYTQANVRVVSWRANRLKCDGSLADFERIVQYIKENSL